MSDTRGKCKELTGKVVSNKMDKTIVVAVDRLVTHSRYMKTVRRRKKYHAHDAENACKIGDTVVIHETRPLSKLKRWRLHEVTARAAV
jgi:small subunit ribosomal protein S17